MRYSIVICTYNRCRILAEALRSQALVRPPTGCDIELIVVDNASPDDTAAVVRDFAALAPFPVRYLYEARNGHSFALNTGVAAATGDFIVFTDDDAFPDPHWLEALHRSFVERGADWALGPIRPRWEGRQPSFYGKDTQPLFVVLDYGTEPFVVADETHLFFGVNHACRREAMERVGNYREDLGLFPNKGSGGNDEDLFRRVLKAGLRIVYTPDAMIEHLMPEQRCRKKYFRFHTINNTAASYQALQNDLPDGPKILGLPRYFYRKPIEHFGGWLLNTLRGRWDSAFLHELRLLKFVSLIGYAVYYQFALRRRLTDVSPEGRAPLPTCSGPSCVAGQE